MQKTRMIQFRITQEQYLRIHNNAEAKGFKTVSAYIRHVALEKDLIIEHLITETHKITIELKEIIQTKNHLLQDQPKNENLI